MRVVHFVHFALVALVALFANACGGAEDGFGDDGGTTCDISIDVSPANPQINDTVRATAVVSRAGVAEYQWSVTRSGQTVPFTIAGIGGDAIEFQPDQNGSYVVSVEVDLYENVTCSDGMTIVEVGTSDDAGEIVFRPAHSFAPKVFPLRIVPGADKELGTLSLDAPRRSIGHVVAGGADEPAFLRFPAGASTPATPVIEAFTEQDGTYDVAIGPDTTDVIVVPLASDVPWRRFSLNSVQLDLTAGVARSGTVRGPNGALLAGARVQILDAIGVASTVATSDGNGAFTVQVAQNATPLGTITVTPPAGSGLPKLTGMTLFGAESIDVRYSASLILRNAGGTQVTRSGPLASTPVVIVGSIAQAGTVSASEGSVDLVGTVRIATTTTGAGALPSLQVPAAALSAVVSPAASDHAVAAFDTTTAVPGTITAPAMTAFSMQLTSATADSLPGATLTLEPTGALAIAGVPAVTVTADGDGVAAGSAAAGGTYRLRASDPEGRVGTYIEEGVQPGQLLGVLAFPPAVKVTGTLTELGGSPRVAGAIVEIYCTGCSRTLSVAPLAQGITDAQGRFSLTVTSPE